MPAFKVTQEFTQLRVTLTTVLKVLLARRFHMPFPKAWAAQQPCVRAKPRAGSAVPAGGCPQHHSLPESTLVLTFKCEQENPIMQTLPRTSVLMLWPGETATVTGC